MPLRPLQLVSRPLLLVTRPLEQVFRLLGHVCGPLHLVSGALQYVFRLLHLVSRPLHLVLRPMHLVSRLPQQVSRTLQYASRPLLLVFSLLVCRLCPLLCIKSPGFCSKWLDLYKSRSTPLQQLKMRYSVIIGPNEKWVTTNEPRLFHLKYLHWIIRTVSIFECNQTPLRTVALYGNTAWCRGCLSLLLETERNTEIDWPHKTFTGFIEQLFYHHLYMLWRHMLFIMLIQPSRHENEIQ